MSSFTRSIGALAKLIATDLGAESVVLYVYRVDKAALYVWESPELRVALTRCEAAWLAALADPVILTTTNRPLKVSAVLLQDFATVLVAPVTNERHPKTFLFVGFRSMGFDPDLSRLKGFTDGLRLIVDQADQEQSVQALIGEVWRLELELADGKIADRAAGLVQGIAAEQGASDLIRRHIARVLSSVEHTGGLTKRVELLKAELAARERITLAKAIVQEEYGVTEQEAYIRLLRASRRTRRSLAEVAEEIILAEENEQRRRIA